MANNKGQTVIESIFALVFLIATVSGLFLIIYLSLFKVWMTHVAYEATICLAKDISPAVCKTISKDRLNTLNFFSYPLILRTQVDGKGASAEVVAEFFPKKYLKVGQRMALPLKPGNL